VVRMLKSLRKKRGEITSDQILIIILALLAAVLILGFVFKVDINRWISNTFPSYDYSDEDELIAGVDELADLKCDWVVGRVGRVGAEKGKIYLGDYIPVKEAIDSGVENLGFVDSGLTWDYDDKVAKVDKFNWFWIVSDVRIAEIKKQKSGSTIAEKIYLLDNLFSSKDSYNKMKAEANGKPFPSWENLKKLHGAFKWTPGFKICVSDQEKKIWETQNSCKVIGCENFEGECVGRGDARYSEFRLNETKLIVPYLCSEEGIDCVISRIPGEKLAGDDISFGDIETFHETKFDVENQILQFITVDGEGIALSNKNEIDIDYGGGVYNFKMNVVSDERYCYFIGTNKSKLVSGFSSEDVRVFNEESISGGYQSANIQFTKESYLLLSAYSLQGEDFIYKIVKTNPTSGNRKI